MSPTDPLDRFSRHARAAGDDRPEPVDVSARVLARLPGRAPTPPGWAERWDLPPGLLAAAALALVVTGVAGALAAPFVDPLLDPLLGLMDLPLGELP